LMHRNGTDSIPEVTFEPLRTRTFRIGARRPLVALQWRFCIIRYDHEHNINLRQFQPKHLANCLFHTRNRSTCSYPSACEGNNAVVLRPPSAESPPMRSFWKNPRWDQCSARPSCDVVRDFVFPDPSGTPQTQPLPRSTSFNANFLLCCLDILPSRASIIRLKFSNLNPEAMLLVRWSSLFEQIFGMISKTKTTTN
jgi:hypothetical protein